RRADSAPRILANVVIYIRNSSCTCAEISATPFTKSSIGVLSPRLSSNRQLRRCCGTADSPAKNQRLFREGKRWERQRASEKQHREIEQAWIQASPGPAGFLTWRY